MARGDRGYLEWRNGWKFLSCKVINYRQPLTNTLPSFARLRLECPGVVFLARTPRRPVTLYPSEGENFCIFHRPYYRPTPSPAVSPRSATAANLSGFYGPRVPFRPRGFSSCIKLLSSLILLGSCAEPTGRGKSISPFCFMRPFYYHAFSQQETRTSKRCKNCMRVQFLVLASTRKFPRTVVFAYLSAGQKNLDLNCKCSN